jgi:hypothetical protein
MNLFEAVLLFVFALLIVLGSFFFIAFLNNDGDSINEQPLILDKTKCNWTPGNGERYCSEGTYFFSPISKECKLWNGGACTTDPPFDSLAECQRVCEE